MTREEKIKKIYEVVADKKLSKNIEDRLIDVYDCTRCWTGWNMGTMTQDDFSLVTDDDNLIEDLQEVLIGHCLKWIEGNYKDYIVDGSIGQSHHIRMIVEYRNKTAPIEHQDNEQAVDFMFNLINTEEGRKE